MSRIDEVRAARLEQVKVHAPSRADLYAKVYAGKGSIREAVKAQCLECIGYETKEITNCAAYACPLWFHRPFSGIKAKGAARTPAQIAATAKGILALRQKRLQEATAPVLP